MVTWNMAPWKTVFLYKPVVFHFHACFREIMPTWGAQIPETLECLGWDLWIRFFGIPFSSVQKPRKINLYYLASSNFQHV